MKSIKSIGFIKYYRAGKRLLKDKIYHDARRKGELESLKEPKRGDIINYLLSRRTGKTCYLEIGVRRPENNFNNIVADEKYSVDPGIEYKKNPVDFKMTSDEFFESLSGNKILSSEIRFDVVFLDGLHLADQVDKDIANALKFVKDDGFIVMHDCNPPTEYHARENHYDINTAAKSLWSGTTWKAFLKWRFNPSINSCCIDTDWGIGIISKTQPIGKCTTEANPFFEFYDFAKNNHKYLNLMSFDDFKKLV